jgi:hypothetical protein
MSFVPHVDEMIIAVGSDVFHLQFKLLMYMQSL